MGIDFSPIANFAALPLIALAGPAVVFILSTAAARSDSLAIRPSAIRLFRQIVFTEKDPAEGA